MCQAKIPEQSNLEKEAKRNLGSWLKGTTNDPAGGSFCQAKVRFRDKTLVGNDRSSSIAFAVVQFNSNATEGYIILSFHFELFELID